MIIDRTSIKEKIQIAANELLEGELTEYSFGAFAEEAKSIVKTSWDNYVIEQEKEAVNSLQGEEKDGFLDTTSGYKRQMRDWAYENDIEIRNQELPVESIPDPTPRKNLKPALISLGVGTVVAACIFPFSPLASICIELVALGLAYKFYVDNNKPMEAEHVKNEMIDTKARFRSELLKDVDAWLDSAQAKSDEVLQSFKVKDYAIASVR